MFLTVLITAATWFSVTATRPVVALKAAPTVAPTTVAPTTGPLMVLTVPTVKPTTADKRFACQKVSNAFGQAIAEGSKSEVPIRFVRGQAMRSLDFGTNFVAIEFATLGIGNQVAVFTSTSLVDVGQVMAADEMARAFTSWPDARKGDPMLTKAEAQINRAIICLQ